MENREIGYKAVLVLPYPISANRYWRPVRLGKHITIVPTKEAKAYQAQAALLARTAGFTKPILGRVQVGIQLYPHRPLDWQKRAARDPLTWDDTVQCLDIDNARKVLYDALKGVAFEDDKRIFRDWAQRMEPDAHGARVVVTIAPLAAKDNPQAAMEWAGAA